MGNCLQAPSNHVVVGSNKNKNKNHESSAVIQNIPIKKDHQNSRKNSNNGTTIAPSDIWTRLASSPQIGEWLKNVPIFCRVPEDKRNKVGGVMETMTFKSGENVFEQGDEGDRFYIIKEGIASVRINVPRENSHSANDSVHRSIIMNEDSSRSSFSHNSNSVNNLYITKEVAQLKQGDYFGETALLSKANRNATMTAIDGDLVTLTLDSKTFKKLFKGLNVQLAKRKGVIETVDDARDNIDENESDLQKNTQKSPQEIKQIVDILNGSVLFERLNNDQKKQIAEFMWSKQYGPNETIGQKGEILSHLFIVKRGKAVEFVSKRVRKEIIEEPESLVEGSLIGEIGLMYNSPLQSTYKTNLDPNGTEFWIINRKKFRKIVKDSSQKKLFEFENFIKTVPILESLLDFERKKIAETLEEIHFSNNHIIVRQGDIGDTFYIIRKGEAVVTKYDEEDDDKIEKEVCRLGPGDFFGERALIKNDVRAATVKVVSDGMECLMLDREGFILLLGPLGDIMERKIATEYDNISISIDNNGKSNGKSDLGTDLSNENQERQYPKPKDLN